MGDKPQPKSEVAIYYAIDVARDICVYASPDALGDLKEFGRLWQDSGKENEPSLWHISVDARYDFQEVVDYIKNYG